MDQLIIIFNFNINLFIKIMLFEEEQDGIMNNRFQSIKHRATATV